MTASQPSLFVVPAIVGHLVVRCLIVALSFSLRQYNDSALIIITNCECFCLFFYSLCLLARALLCVFVCTPDSLCRASYINFISKLSNSRSSCVGPSFRSSCTCVCVYMSMCLCLDSMRKRTKISCFQLLSSICRSY